MAPPLVALGLLYVAVGAAAVILIGYLCKDDFE